LTCATRTKKIKIFGTQSILPVSCHHGAVTEHISTKGTFMIQRIQSIQSIHSTRRSVAALVIVAAALASGALALARTSAEDPPKTQTAGTASTSGTASTPEECSTVVFNITSGPDNLLAVTTAFHVAEEALADNRRVILFFNLAGMNVPLKRFPQDLRVGRDRPVWTLLNDLMSHGAQVLVARGQVEALGMYEADFVDGAQVAPYAGNIFAKMTKNTVVFTY
jgi:predicted peroxiredoxin